MEQLAMQKAINDFVEASKGLAGSDQPDAEAYCKVLKVAPQLIQSESDPELFLQREKGNAVAAARRLLNYWTKRLQIFGPRRAFLPLRDGALGPEELAIADSGIFVRVGHDAHGRDVFCIDLNRRLKGMGGADTNLIRARTFVYISSLASSNPKSLTEGFGLVIPLNEKNTLQLPGADFFRDLFENVLPVKVHTVFIACIPLPGTKSMYRDFLIPGYIDAVREWSETKTTQTIIGKSPRHLLKKFKSYGIGEQVLPPALGGSFSYDNWTSFLAKDVARFEENPRRYKPSEKRKPLKKRAIVQEGREEPNAAIMATKPPPQPKQAPTPVPNQAKRQMTNDEEKGLIQQIPFHSIGVSIDPNITEKVDKETLLNFHEVMSINPGRCADEKVEREAHPHTFLKKRDAIYSKRKYYKKKLKLDCMEKTKDDLELENGTLQRENRRLEFLVTDAQKIVLEETQKPSFKQRQEKAVSRPQSDTLHSSVASRPSHENNGNCLLRLRLTDALSRKTDPKETVPNTIATAVPSVPGAESYISASSTGNHSSISEFLRCRNFERSFQGPSRSLPGFPLADARESSMAQATSTALSQEDSLFSDFFPMAPSVSTVSPNEATAAADLALLQSPLQSSTPVPRSSNPQSLQHLSNEELIHQFFRAKKRESENSGLPPEPLLREELLVLQQLATPQQSREERLLRLLLGLPAPAYAELQNILSAFQGRL